MGWRRARPLDQKDPHRWRRLTRNQEEPGCPEIFMFKLAMRNIFVVEKRNSWQKHTHFCKWHFQLFPQFFKKIEQGMCYTEIEFEVQKHHAGIYVHGDACGPS